MPTRARDYRYFDAPFLALAHRGGSLLPGNEGRENTLHAFRAAAALGYRYAETDVHATADGHLVAFHDDTLDRVTDGHGHIAELPFAEVRRARVHGVDEIPALDDLFEALPEMRFNIDIKAAGAVAPLAAAITRHRAHDRVCVASFSASRLGAFRRLMGTQVATSMSSREVAWSVFVPLLPRLWPAAGVALQVPPRHQIAGRQVPVVTTEVLAGAHAAGKQVHVWTIDEAAEMHALIDMGVDGLVTDRPDVLRDVLIERGLWS